MAAIDQPRQARHLIAGQPGMQGLAGDPELGRHHHLGFTTFHGQHSTVALLTTDKSIRAIPAPSSSTSDGDRKVGQAHRQHWIGVGVSSISRDRTAIRAHFGHSCLVQMMGNAA